MKKINLFILFAVALFTCACDNGTKPIAQTPESKKQTSPNENSNSRVKPFEVTKEKKPVTIDVIKLSEAHGNRIIKENLKLPKEYQYDTKLIIKGIQDHAAGKPSPMTEKEFSTVFNAYTQQILGFLKENKVKESNAVFINNAKEEGFVEIIPGKLQYKITKKGEGATVLPHATPMIRLSSYNPNGTVMHKAKEDSKPIPMKLIGGFPGMAQTVTGMKEGEVRMIYIHPDILNTSGKTNFVDPVIFEVEVVQADSPKNMNESNRISEHPEDDEDDDED